MTHPNDMTAWADIQCRRGPGHPHISQRGVVHLGVTHGYRDLCEVPLRYGRSIAFTTWDSTIHPVDGGPYCPAHDAVSETLRTHGIWEPQETTFVLWALTGHKVHGWFVDLGAQLGWYSAIAQSCGVPVYAVEADPANFQLLVENVDTGPADAWAELARIDEHWSVPPVIDRVRLLKCDLEGAEFVAMEAFDGMLRGQAVDYVLMEASPVFKGGGAYPALLDKIMGYGYSLWRFPPKAKPAVRMDSPPDVMERLASGDDIDPHQEDVVLVSSAVPGWPDNEAAWPTDD